MLGTGGGPDWLDRDDLVAGPDLEQGGNIYSITWVFDFFALVHVSHHYGQDSQWTHGCWKRLRNSLQGIQATRVGSFSRFCWTLFSWVSFISTIVSRLTIHVYSFLLFALSTLYQEPNTWRTSFSLIPVHRHRSIHTNLVDPRPPSLMLKPRSQHSRALLVPPNPTLFVDSLSFEASTSLNPPLQSNSDIWFDFG